MTHIFWIQDIATKISELNSILAVSRDFQQCGVCDQQNLRSACAYAQSDQSLCWSLEYSMSVEQLTEHHLEFLSLTRGGTGSSESILVKMPHCWKSHVAAHIERGFLNFRALSVYSRTIARAMVVELEMLKGIPGYSMILKAVLKTQIQLLVSENRYFCVCSNA